jgi:hypothetical protein
MPILVDHHCLAGQVVTTDAMGCSTAITAQIVACSGEDVLALTPNRSTLWDQVEDRFGVIDAPDDQPRRGNEPWTHGMAELRDDRRSDGDRVARSARPGWLRLARARSGTPIDSFART